MRRANAFELLTAEHDRLRRALGHAIQHAHSPGGGRKARTALRSFLLGLRLHVRREEKALYPLCESHFGGPESAVAVLRDDHHAICRAVASIDPDDAGLALRLEALAKVLDVHLSREERVLFPLAATRLSEAESSFLVRALGSMGRR